MSARERPRGGWIGYLSSAGLSVSVTIGRLSLNGWFGHNHNRHLIFLPTVTLAAWLWGFGPGLLATAVFGVALRAFWFEGHESFFHAYSDIVLFAAVGAGACAVIQSLHAARRRANDETRAREQVLAIVAHDLRNPLNAVMLAEERLRAGAELGPAPAVGRALQTIRRAVHRMATLITDLVDSTHIEQGNLYIARSSVAVGGLVQELSDLFAESAREHGLSLEVTATSEAALVDGDRERLVQVLGNLLGNAIKFTPAGGRVTLRAVEVTEAVRFEVEDTGRGIEAAHLPFIFERYRTYDDAQGTGLGLFIARHLVRLHGGELNVASETGRGARFWFDVARARGA
jgi:signal transduction histidine kinase